VLSGFTLTNGHANYGGGALCDTIGVITNCIFTGNTAEDGGGAYNGNIVDCFFRNNSAALGGGVCGTLFSYADSNCTVKNCIFTNNSAGIYGGGAETTRLLNCVLTGNSANIGGGAEGCVLVGDPALVAEQMRRLQRLAHRVVWLNPLKASPEYEPLARGMAAALPYVDVFATGHNLTSLEAIADVIARR
jgi:parallel beta-helix repeat protein